MLIDSVKLEDNSVINADICIIGAGPAGISIAERFFNTAQQIVLLEGGGLEFDVESQDIYKGVNLGTPYVDLDTARLRFFGGTTNHWGGHVRPFTESDFEQQSWIDKSGWPIKKSDLDDYYEKAFSLCMYGTGENHWDTQYWLDKKGIASSIFDEKVFSLKIEQQMRRVLPSFQSFGSFFQESLEQSKNISVYLNANVTEFNTSDNGDNIVSVSAFSKSGSAFSVQAKYFVLATGGVENARLLLVSNNKIKTGIGNENGLVGRYFCGHIVANAGLFVTSGKLPIESLFEWSEIKSGSAYLASLVLSPELKSANKLTNSFIRLRRSSPHTSGGTKSAWHIIEDIKQGRLSDKFLHHIGKVITEIDDVVKKQYYKMTEPSTSNHYEVLIRIEPVPNYNSRIMLIDEKDKFGKQRIGLNWQLSEIDKKTLFFMANTFAIEMGKLGFGRVQIDPDLESIWPSKLDIGYHHMGTTRMANTATEGVVDKDCKVFSTNNLYIAGSSVFSTGGSGTPTLTLVALALRLADHLKGKLS